MNKQIDELSKDIWKGTQLAFSELERLKMIVLNLQITCAHLPETPDTRALDKTAEIMKDAIVKIEEYTKQGRDLAKLIGKVNNE